MAAIVSPIRRRRLLHAVALGTSLGWLLAALPAPAADTAYLGLLQERARRERLAERPEWRSLLHYRATILSPAGASMVDNDAFFLSPAGRRDPQAELEATLEGFFRSAGADEGTCAQCTFAARYDWLKQTLGFDPARLPESRCLLFRKWMKELNPEGITLIFPAAYLNNPASMFGHTLLRVDARGQDNQTRLLAYTINFAADSGGQQHGAAFAFKGLFGMYQGQFSVAPYYLKVRAYGDIENRDIWEYRLKLDRGEIDRLLRHVWEMRVARFDYYFADENCSYQLLSLLDSARPGLGLTDRFPLWAIPSETVRAAADAGLIERVSFRAARRSVLQERARTLEPRLRKMARLMADADLEPDAPQVLQLGVRDQARVIELAIDDVAYRQAPRASPEEPPSGVLARLLEHRSRLPAPDQTPAVAAPGIPPGTGHKPARLALGYGVEDRRQFAQLDVCPGYHELFDPEGGYARDAHISALRASLRHYPEEGTGELERLDIIDIMSLSSWGIFQHPASWKAGAGVFRKRLSRRSRPLLGHVSGGIGISRDFAPRLSAHVFAEGTVEASRRFACVLAPGIGPGAGILLDIGKRWRSGLSLRWQQFFLREWRADHEVLLKSRVTLRQQDIIGFELGLKRESGSSFPAGRLYWQTYF